jgi:hypothetical protein
LQDALIDIFFLVAVPKRPYCLSNFLHHRSAESFGVFEGKRKLGFCKSKIKRSAALSNSNEFQSAFVADQFGGGTRIAKSKPLSVEAPPPERTLLEEIFVSPCSA